MFGRNGTLMSDDVFVMELGILPCSWSISSSSFLHTTNSITRASDSPVCIIITVLGEVMLWPSRKTQVRQRDIRPGNCLVTVRDYQKWADLMDT